MSDNIKSIKFHLPLNEIEKSKPTPNFNNLNLTINNSNNNNNSQSTRIESNSKQNTERNQDLQSRNINKNILTLNNNENTSNFYISKTNENINNNINNINNNNINNNISNNNNNNNNENNNNNNNKEKIKKNINLLEHKKTYHRHYDNENKFIVIPKVNNNELDENKRFDRFGQQITKKNKKNIKVTFKDEILNEPLEEIEYIQSIKSFNYVKGMPSEREVFGKNKICCSSCIIF